MKEEDGRYAVLKERFATPEEKKSAADAAKQKKRISPDAYLRQCIATSVPATKEELDDLFTLIGDAKPDDIYSIEKFVTTSDLVKGEWHVIRLIYTTWLAGHWDKKVYPRFARKTSVDEKLAAMGRLIELNAKRRRVRKSF